MFTGIIEELGHVRAVEKRGEDARIVIEARTVTESSQDGDSISVNGVCLTALDMQPDSFAADVSKETLFRSTLGNLKEGSPVNLERAVTPATRLGGHIVQGHVDARGKFLGAENHGESWTFRIAYPKEIARYLVFKGSVAVEGISLTIANLRDDYFEIAVNGVCLTALEVQPDSFAADVSKETLFRSTLGSLHSGSPVNLERSVTPVTRLGGHIVQGHVDARGKFLSSKSHGESWTFRIAYPKEISQYLVFKGSVAVEGISLTIAELTDDYFEIAVIPKTWEVTNFSHLKPGDEVNLEADIIAKYVERILISSRK